jgi:lysophospholipase L1-like esterase
MNVAKLCALTSMCTRQDIHPNAQGYAVIAQAFAKVIK